jgi:hypothetical protein
MQNGTQRARLGTEHEALVKHDTGRVAVMFTLVTTGVMRVGERDS